MISSVLSIASTAFWLVALLPQQWQNFSTKSVDGLSLHFMVLWLLGDSCNLIGCFLTQQLPFQTCLAVYFIFNDIVLDFQYWYYRKEDKQRRYSQISLHESDPINPLPNNDKVYLATEVGETSSISSHPIKIASVPMVVAVSLSSLSSVSALPITTDIHTRPSDIEFIGLCFAWLCTIVYCCSRIPQLYHNYTRKSVDGISPLLFTFALLGNLTYSLSIVSAEIPKEMSYSQFLIKELPYLIGSLGTVLFDAIYFLQRKIYKPL
ncbi:hypothetical protein CANINC_003807 [Pichia inconspicua]|uniref:Uncharacterized protein n=1 Tax=Pichia inconspicua TaxID=52247 RepID=A0A4T0WYZ9_9ASCO|nr:hypothetical protein CANINC_003807 [[Candida] inconspicua]